MAKNIRTTAIDWFRKNYPGEREPVYTSKFYTSEESWSKSQVWFFQIPSAAIDPGKNRFIHLLCKNHLKGESFIYLKVPTTFMFNNKHDFDINKRSKMIRIYLSAEPGDMFHEVRMKNSKINFSEFVLNAVT